MYPVVGIWTRGLDIGNVFLKSGLSENAKNVLTQMLTKYATSNQFKKVSFAADRVKFIYVPFIAKGVSPPILLVDMNLSTQAMDESIPISVPPPPPARRQSNFKLWENFLTKTSLKDPITLEDIEDRINKLDSEYDAILTMLAK